MTDPHDRDPHVAALLASVDVPDHRPGFWEGLRHRLDDDAAPATATVSASAGQEHDDHDHHHRDDHEDPFGPQGHGHEHDLVEPLRPRSNLRRVVSIAAVIAAVTLTASVVRQRQDAADRLRIAGPPDAKATTPSPPSSAPSTGATAPPPEVAVLDWLDAVGAGDTRAAAALTGPSSQAYVSSLGANLEGFLTEAGEGYGAWSTSPDRRTTEIDLGTEGGITRAVVVVSGTWTGEGTDGFRADALPVVRTADGPWLVEPWAFAPDAGGRLELVSPEPGEEGPGGLPPDGVIEVTAPGDGDFAFSLDDGEVVRVAGRRAAAGASTARFDPPGEMPSRSHLAVVAYLDGDGTFTALAFTFLVEG